MTRKVLIGSLGLVVFSGLVVFGLLRPWSAGMRALGEPAPGDGLERAVFAGGCFWSMVAPFEGLAGVSKVVAGYTGGTAENPTYKQVIAGGTGHREAVEVIFDPREISYDQLLQAYWHHIDPFDAAGQFCDRGDQYRTAIFAEGRVQRKLAEQSKQAVAKQLGKPVITAVVPAGPFYRAEDYHQGYARKNPFKYQLYRDSCGRDERVAEIWGAGGQ